MIADSTYSPGIHTRISGMAVSVAADNVNIDGATHTLPSQDTPTPVLVGGQTIATASNWGVLIGSATYLPGIRANVFGTAFSGADSIVVDEFICVLPTYPTEKPILIDGQSIIKASNDGFVVGDSTVAPDSQIIISGHTTSADFSSVVVDGSTYALPTNTASRNAIPQSITLATTVIISAGSSAATLSDTTYSIPLDDRALIVNGQMMAFPTGLQSSSTIAGQIFTANPIEFAVDGHSMFMNGSAITLSGIVYHWALRDCR